MSEKIIQAFKKELTDNNPSLRPITVRQYVFVLVRLMKVLEELNVDCRFIGNIPICFIQSPEDVVKIINNLDKKDCSKKNIYSCVMSLMRGQAMLQPNIYDEPLEIFRKNFEILKKSINAQQELQQPKKKELQLKELSIKVLKSGLSYHANKLRKNKYDLDSALLLLVGTINTELCLRNEPASMVITNEYLDKEMFPKQNFLWNKGRNKKMFIIRENKVREGGKDPEKALEITGKFNSVINKYLVALENKIGENIKDLDMIPLIYKTKGEGDLITNGGYVQLVKRCWQHMDLILTSTLIRKVFAIDIRNQHNGKLTEEKKACEKLDHSLAVHNNNYVLFFE